MKDLSLAQHALQHLQARPPGDPRTVANSRTMKVAPSSPVPSAGFGYPLDGFGFKQALGSLFQLPTLLGFAPSELFSVG
jgi:hypothetical protein